MLKNVIDRLWRRAPKTKTEAQELIQYLENLEDAEGSDPTPEEMREFRFGAYLQHLQNIASQIEVEGTTVPQRARRALTAICASNNLELKDACSVLLFVYATVSFAGYFTAYRSLSDKIEQVDQQIKFSVDAKHEALKDIRVMLEEMREHIERTVAAGLPGARSDAARTVRECYGFPSLAAS